MVGISLLLNHGDSSSEWKESDNGQKSGASGSASPMKMNLGIENSPGSNDSMDKEDKNEENDALGSGLNSSMESVNDLAASSSESGSTSRLTSSSVMDNPKGSKKNSTGLLDSRSSSSLSGNTTPLDSSDLKAEPKSGKRLPSPVTEQPDFGDITAKLPHPKIKKKFLVGRKLVKIALRRKLVPKKSAADNHVNSKLHVRSLEAGLRVKLTMAPSISALYKSLIPHTNKRQVEPVVNSDFQRSKNDLGSPYQPSDKVVSKLVQLIDNNLVNLSGFSNKVLQNYSLNGKNDSDNRDGSKSTFPTFNSLDTAVSALFGHKEYTLVRVTRSTTDDLGGSVLLKLETARLGDYKLIDDEEFFDEMFCSIGNPKDPPNSLFIKKVVARPRYKSNMKIYVVPGNVNCSLYTDERMLERDLINGVIDFDDLDDKAIYATFSHKEIISDFKSLVSASEASAANEPPFEDIPEEKSEYSPTKIEDRVSGTLKEEPSEDGTLGRGPGPPSVSRKHSLSEPSRPNLVTNRQPTFVPRLTSSGVKSKIILPNPSGANPFITPAFRDSYSERYPPEKSTKPRKS